MGYSIAQQGAVQRSSEGVVQLTGCSVTHRVQSIVQFISDQGQFVHSNKVNIHLLISFSLTPPIRDNFYVLVVIFKTKYFCKTSSNYLVNVQMRCVTSILLGVWQFSSFTLSEWGPGLCSIAGKGAAANFLQGKRRKNLCKNDFRHTFKVYSSAESKEEQRSKNWGILNELYCLKLSFHLFFLFTVHYFSCARILSFTRFH